MLCSLHHLANVSVTRTLVLVHNRTFFGRVVVTRHSSTQMQEEREDILPQLLPVAPGFFNCIHWCYLYEQSHHPTLSSSVCLSPLSSPHSASPRSPKGPGNSKHDLGFFFLKNRVSLGGGLRMSRQGDMAEVNICVLRPPAQSHDVPWDQY